VPSGLSILLAPFGSEGDVRPLLWLAEGLAARGHRITFLITPYYGELVAARGWRWLPLGTAEGFAATMRDPRLWQPRHGSELVLREMLGSLPRCQAALDGAGGRFDLVIGTTLAAGVFTWAEKNGVPRLMTHLQPMCLRSMGDCPVFLEGWEWLSAAPAFVKRGAFWLIDQALIRLLLPPLNAHRATLGLRPLRRMEEAWHGADGVAALFPAWYAPFQPDWPGHLRQFGFPFSPSDTGSAAPLSAELETFLAAGEPPILWTHGSANLHTEKFAAGAQSATKELGARGLLVGPAFQNEPATAARDFMALKHAPFEQVFSRCRAVVHHGGIGTLTKALAAGVPQLIIPRSHDQPDNARRLERMGVGASLRYRDFSGAAAAARLRGLLESPAVQTACEVYQKKLLADDPRPALCAWAEELAGR
jgi:rhamnosyltransferase subunit B